MSMFKKLMILLIAAIGVFSAIATVTLALGETVVRAKAPIELWETLCNKPELKSITIIATYQDGRVETNDYYCVK